MRPLIPILLVLFLVGCADSAKEQQHKEFVSLVEQFIQDARLLSNADLARSWALQSGPVRLKSLCDTAENKVKIWQSGTEGDLARYRIVVKMRSGLASLLIYAMSIEMISMAPSQSELEVLITQSLNAQQDAKVSVDELEKLLEEYKRKH